MSLRDTLTTKEEPEVIEVSAGEARLLDKHATEVEHAICEANDARRTKNDVKETLADDFFDSLDDAGKVSYLVRSGPHKGELMTMSTQTRFNADMGKLRRRLTVEQVAAITETSPRFDPDRAERAIQLGIVTPAQLAGCLTARLFPTIALKKCPEGRTYRFLKPGQAQITRLNMHPKLTAEWVGDDD